ncbi:high-affinity choline transporter 1-like isoform X1 [Eriocheir sinensis]|uniref:high-affinity choline transporter 1-like isoform X1 n=1 Tax=Eriocheir sinensis TaxID=95602 RepID=UPI0021CA9358|nr:high-affinity choline transporter 1-like isoform X1 [Eriocheir sinensis]XP_050719787.1 high-affinity choline transporter 1-like isoform X1 [Eriocheir sinensis]
MTINVGGIIAIVLFYLLILVVGIWAAKKKPEGEDDADDVMLAGRSIGVFVGIFTMTATWVGGGYINGTAEAVYDTGLVWCQAPFGYAMSLIFGGVLFANKMRSQGYVTMLDPLQDKFGERMGGLLFLPALCGEVFWSAAILGALGATLSVVLNLDQTIAVVLSACIAVFYTLFGGLYAVAYTDVIQLICIFIGLWLCIPFAWNHPAVGDVINTDKDWIGAVPTKQLGLYFDYCLLLVFGGIPWQVYFQRVLSSKSGHKAQILSYVAAFGCLIMAVPPVIIGAIAKVTNWNDTDLECEDALTCISTNHTAMILPLVIQHLTPPFVSFVGLGAISAAVMSSADSSVLSAASMFARNIWKLIFRQNASETEVLWVMRVAIFFVGALATTLALTIPSIYGLWYLSSDLVYVILFPQLLMVVHFRNHCNLYGSLGAYIVGLIVRLLGGESMIGIPPIIKYPWYDEENEVQLFPFRTLAMLLSGLFLVSASMFSRWVFETGRLPPKYDVFRCVVNIPDDVQKVGEPQEGEMTMMACHSVVKYDATGEMNGRINPALTLGSDSEEDIPAPTTTTADGKVKKRLVGEIISPPPITSPKKHDQTKL